MKTNIGTIDLIVRLTLGVFIITIGAYLKSVWGVLGMIPIITAFSGFCPIYFLLGINSNGKKEKIKKP
jgi:hypothetical protein